MKKDSALFKWICVVLGLLGLLVSGCAGSIKNLPVNAWVQPVPSGTQSDDRSMQIAYLGTGGYLIHQGERAIMTAPFFSHPSIPKMLLGRIEADKKQINRFLSEMKPDLEPVKAILVGHAHYDHLMDVPYIAGEYAPHALIYGSRTMSHTLAPVLPQQRRIAVNADAATSEGGGCWLGPEDQNLRFMALISEHAPHVMGIKAFKGHYEEDLSALPTKAAEWVEGQTFAYLIDFLRDDGETVAFRIHYQDAASTPPLGFPPRFEKPADKRRVDVAILCVPGFDQVEGYPEGILVELNPRYVILGHWENFFKALPDDMQKLTVVPATNVRKFIRRVQTVLPEDAKFILPQPGTWLTFPPVGNTLD